MIVDAAERFLKNKKAEILSEKDKRKNSAKLTSANDLFGQILAWHRMLAISILASLISINEVAMTRYDQQILFTALAFLAVVQKDGEKATEGSAQKVMMLAKLLGEFCAENVPSSILPISSINDDKDAAAKVDTVIERHIKELRQNETTVLPEDKASLMQMYVRLQFRKIHRINAALFSEISAPKLADHVLSQLDEEIEYQEGLS